LNVTVSRNHFGRQVDSFEADLPMPAPEEAPFRAIFIRAPAITEVGADVEVLARVDTHDGQEVIAAVRQGPLLATAFHPELTDDPRWHRYFLCMVRTAAAIA
jgi:5'-phosphate synthase pdxT subunit